jgi:hypothetical protein
VRISQKLCSKKIMSYAPLLDNDPETKNETTALTKQRLVNYNTGTVFSARPVPRLYKEKQLRLRGD